MSERAIVTRLEPEDPDLLVTLQASPPEVEKRWGNQRLSWTLDMLERTLIEFRAAGAYDGSKIDFSFKHGQSVTCEVLATRGDESMPWGWLPSGGAIAPAPKRMVVESPPETKPTPLMDRRLDDVVPAFLGNRALHGLLLFALIVLAVVR